MDSGIGKALLGTPIGGAVLATLIADGITQKLTGGMGRGLLGLGIGGESKEQLDAFTAFQKKQAEFMETENEDANIDVVEEEEDMEDMNEYAYENYEESGYGEE